MEPIKKFRFDRGKAKCPDTPRSSGVATPREMFGRRGSGEFTNRSSFNPVSNTGNMTDRQQMAIEKHQSRLAGKNEKARAPSLDARWNIVEANEDNHEQHKKMFQRPKSAVGNVLTQISGNDANKPAISSKLVPKLKLGAPKPTTVDEGSFFFGKGEQDKTARPDSARVGVARLSGRAADSGGDIIGFTDRRNLKQRAHIGGFRHDSGSGDIFGWQGNVGSSTPRAVTPRASTPRESMGASSNGRRHSFHMNASTPNLLG